MIKNSLSTDIANVGGQSNQPEEIVEYLQKTVGPILVKGLAELTIKRPIDPIEYLGHWLRQQHYVQKFSNLPLGCGERRTDGNLPIFTAVSAKIICPHSDYEIVFCIKDTLFERVNFTASIRGRETLKLLTSGSILVQPNQKHVTLRLPINELSEYLYLLTLKAERGVVCVGGKTWKKSVTILASNLHFNIFAHTDKPRYRPGDLVQFRVILLDRDMKPVTSPAERDDIAIIVSVRTNGKVIKKWTDCHFHFGIFKGDLQLAHDTPLGSWELVVDVVTKRRSLEFDDDDDIYDDNSAINSEKVESISGEHSSAENLGEERSSSSDVEVFSNEISEFVNWKKLMEANKNVTLSFEVVKNFVPKFYLNLKAPQKIRFNPLIKLPIDLEAVYSYGTGVIGEVTIKPEILTGHGWFEDENSPRVIPTTASLTAESGGKITVNVGLEGLLKKGEIKMARFVWLRFRAEVTEQVTGNFETGFSLAAMMWVDPSTIVEEVNDHDDHPISLLFDNDDNDDDDNSDRDDDDQVTTDDCQFSNDSVHTDDSPLDDKNLARVAQLDDQGRTLEYLKVTVQGQDTLSDLKVHVKPPSNLGNDQVTFLNYVIQGRSQILSSGRVQVVQSKEKKGWLQFSLQCPPRAHPTATLLVYQVGVGILNQQVVVIVGSVTFNPVPRADTSNSLEITFLQEMTGGPGQEIGLRVRTKIPKNSVSLLALRCVDVSVLLREPDVIFEDNDIRESEIDLLLQATVAEGQSPFYKFDVSPYGQFAYAGLLILSNAIVQKSNGKRDCHHDVGSGEEEEEDDMGLMEGSKFPQTWIWEEVILSQNGESTETQIDLFRTLPDTMTSWIVSGYVLNEKVGMGVSRWPQELTVSQPLFLSLNLPHSIVKGEVLTLQVLIHNFLPKDPTESMVNEIQVIFDNSLGLFDLPEDEEGSKVVSCPINSVTGCGFKIIAKKFGDLMIHVRGQVTEGSGVREHNTVAQSLRVTPPGQKYRENVPSTLINVGPGDSLHGQKMSLSLQATFPNSIVPGTDRLKLTLMSDLLGHFLGLENIEPLPHLPTDCGGEQNMCNFVVTTLVLKYLDKTNRLSSSVKTHGVKLLEVGYQNELRYIFWNGSFTCFGEEDPNGSTWLTAFVIKSFVQARPFITVDDVVLNHAFEFLLWDNQNFDTGEFTEHGPVLQHQPLTSSGVALTAFVVATFLEEEFEENSIFDEILDDISTAVERGLKFIVESTKNLDTQNDLYTLILTTYALHLGDHGERDKYFDAVNGMVLTSNLLDGSMYWDKVDPTDQMVKHKVSAVSIEMTAYMLLIYLMRGQLQASIPIAQWLSRQRNSGGGFKSTRDTVMGLTALAKFQEMTQATTQLNMKISAWPSQNGETKEGDKIEVRLDEKNAMDLHQIDLSPLTPAVHFEAEGEGMALIQLNWSYFMESDKNQTANNAFSLEVQTTKKPKKKTMFLKILTAFLLGGQSQMAIVEVNLPSGYTVAVKNLEVHLKKDLGDKFGRFQLKNSGTKLNVYLNLLDETGVSFGVLIRNEFDIGQPAKSFVTVYDYYEPGWKVSTFY